MKNNNDAPSKIIQDALFTKGIIKLRQAIKEGENVDWLKGQELARLYNNDEKAEIQKSLTVWAKDGDWSQLSQLVKRFPLQIGNVWVLGQIIYFGGLRRRTEFQDCNEYTFGDSELDSKGNPYLPNGTKTEATTLLKEILTHWIQTILPGYTIEPVKRKVRRGPPNQIDQFDLLLVEEDFSWFKDNLRRNPIPNLNRLKKESPESFKRRAVDLIYEFDKRLPLGTKFLKPPEGQPQKGIPQIPQNVAQEIVDLPANKTKLSINTVIYALMAYYHFGTPKKKDTIRGYLQRAPKM